MNDNDARTFFLFMLAGLGAICGIVGLCFGVYSVNSDPKDPPPMLGVCVVSSYEGGSLVQAIISPTVEGGVVSCDQGSFVAVTPQAPFKAAD